MKKILYILSTLAVMSFMASCDLDVTPEGSITYTAGDQIITSASDLEGFEANVMSSLRSLDYGVFDYASDIMMDYFNAAVDYGNNGGSIHRADDSFTASDYDVEDNWEGCYSAIKNFNILISGAQEVPSGLEADAAIARGEAYFGRAFAYMHLARHFAKAYDSSTAATDLCVPLVTVYDQSARPARASVQEIYDQVKIDLDSAAVLLSGVEGEVRAQRPTSDAVDAMYARYYLDTQQYALAASYASKVIATGKYSLSSTTTAMQNEWVYDEGTEPIVQYYASTTEGYGSHSYYYYVYNDSGTYYTAEYFIPTSTLVDAYDSGDLRLENWFGTNHPAYTNDIYSYHLQYMNTDPSNPDYLVFSKYKGNPDLYTSLPSSIQARKPLLIGEMYLIAAEAYLNAGDATSARSYLNALQSARGASTTAGTETYIKNEWYKETVGEGLRMTCLKRWGDGFSGRPAQSGAASIIMTGTNYEQKVLAADDYHFLWPIPTYEMQTNLNLVQNDGYADVSE